MNTNAATRRHPMLPLTVVGLVAYWWGVAASMHLLEPEFNPIDAPLSAYVLGNYGAWMTTTYFAAGAIMLLLAFGLRKTMPRSSSARVGTLLFCVSGCADVVMGLFPMQYPMKPPLTLHGAVHAVASLIGALTMILGSILFSRSFRNAARWKPVSTVAMVLSLLVLGVFVVGLLSFGGPGGGLRQRVDLALMLAWMAVVVWQWIRWPTEAPAHASPQLSDNPPKLAAN